MSANEVEDRQKGETLRKAQRYFATIDFGGDGILESCDDLLRMVSRLTAKLSESNDAEAVTICCEARKLLSDHRFPQVPR